MHVLEPPDLWQRYIDPAWKHAAPVGLTELRRDMRVKVKSSVVLRIGTVRPQRGDAAGPWSTVQDEAFAEAERRGWDAVSQLEAMDREGLDVAVLFPSRGLFVLGLDAPQVMGIDGLKPDFALEVLDKLVMWHTFGQPLGIMFVAVSLCAGGVLERFPRLRVGLLEGNCGWAPWLFHRLDEHWEWVGRYEVPEVRKKPSEYFRSNCFLAVEADETPVKQYVEWFGDENLVFSTDYPHADSKYPHSVAAFMKLPLSEASQRKILWDNWARLYGVRGR